MCSLNKKEKWPPLPSSSAVECGVLVSRCPVILLLHGYVLFCVSHELGVLGIV